MAKTIKEIKEELDEMTTKYENLLEQAGQLQKEHGRRLTYLRLFEKFINDIDRTMLQLKNDVNEVNASYQEEATGEEI